MMGRGRFSYLKRMDAEGGGGTRHQLMPDRDMEMSPTGRGGGGGARGDGEL